MSVPSTPRPNCCLLLMVSLAASAYSCASVVGGPARPAALKSVLFQYRAWVLVSSGSAYAWPCHLVVARGPGSAAAAMGEYQGRFPNCSRTPWLASCGTQMMSERMMFGGSPAAAAARNFCSRSAYGYTTESTLIPGFSRSNCGMTTFAIVLASASVVLYALQNLRVTVFAADDEDVDDGDDEDDEDELQAVRASAAQPIAHAVRPGRLRRRAMALGKCGVTGAPFGDLGRVG